VGFLDSIKNTFSGQDQPDRRALSYLITSKALWPQTVVRLYSQKNKGMSYKDILNNLKDEDYIQKPGQRNQGINTYKYKQGADAGRSRDLGQFLLSGLQGQASDINQTIQGMPTEMFGMGTAPPIPQNYLVNQLPQQEQNQLGLFLQGLGDTGNVTQLLPSLLQAPTQQKPLTPSEQLTQKKTSLLEQLTPEQQQRGVWPGAFPKDKAGDTVTQRFGVNTAMKIIDQVSDFVRNNKNNMLEETFAAQTLYSGEPDRLKSIIDGIKSRYEGELDKKLSGNRKKYEPLFKSVGLNYDTYFGPEKQKIRSTLNPQQMDLIDSLSSDIQGIRGY